MSTEIIKATLMEKIAAIQKDNASARLVFRAQTRLVKGLQCEANVRNFPALPIDEPLDLGGDDTAMNPVELLLAALGTCQEIVYAAYGAVMGIPLDEIKVNVKGYLDLRGLLAMDDAIPAGYQRVVFETTIKSSADADTVRKLVAMAESHCPVLDTLKRPIDVDGKVLLNGRELQLNAAAAA